jgi:hypothetical protein
VPRQVAQSACDRGIFGYSVGPHYSPIGGIVMTPIPPMLSRTCRDDEKSRSRVGICPFARDPYWPTYWRARTRVQTGQVNYRARGDTLSRLLEWIRRRLWYVTISRRSQPPMPAAFYNAALADLPSLLIILVLMQESSNLSSKVFRA